MDTDRLQAFSDDARRTAARFRRAARRGTGRPILVHHNDADGIAAAAAVSCAIDLLGPPCRRLPVEKIHQPVVARIHADARGIILYADLGGQSAALIGRYTAPHHTVFLLDHHLPGAATPGNVLHLNPEHHGISGDTDVSGAAVGALFAGKLLEEAALWSADHEASLAALGVIGAVGDGQLEAGTMTGLNRRLLETALRGGTLVRKAAGLSMPGFQGKAVSEIVETLNLLGSVGFYSGRAQTGVDFLLKREGPAVFLVAEQLRALKDSLFAKEAESIREQGLSASHHFQWVDVRNRFAPMGVKAIGLFLEYLIAQKLVAGDRYLIGYQHLPSEMPGLGRIAETLTKVSARVPSEVRAAIQKGRLPDFMTLVPQAAERVQGAADGCHRFAAACLIARGRETQFRQALEDVLAATRRG